MSTAGHALARGIVTLVASGTSEVTTGSDTTTIIVGALSAAAVIIGPLLVAVYQRSREERRSAPQLMPDAVTDREMRLLDDNAGLTAQLEDKAQLIEALQREIADLRAPKGRRSP